MSTKHTPMFSKCREILADVSSMDNSVPEALAELDAAERALTPANGAVERWEEMVRGHKAANTLVELDQWYRKWTDGSKDDEPMFRLAHEAITSLRAEAAMAREGAIEDVAKWLESHAERASGLKFKDAACAIREHFNLPKGDAKCS